ncbi:MAG: hypothetical protein ABS87_01680 [Sphingomonas sp. SCN 67-18]|uniref:ABC transporter ATP-binding protein n=1 Tax=uncultured Sphingomonas sp. TaxID=158754 RepID=UPI00086E222D|nr:ABC transporter ATP-binding protein [Sphingomonas sp. SCN 67-18]ODU22600.1 MAG: hypothetical protein ABS87_01680 [Sphingomonas sp. SCN 67-18]
MSATALMDVRDVARRYPGRVAVESARFALQPGRVACLLGPSGCGKSTLLRMIAGLEPVDEGQIVINGALMSAPGTAVAPEQRGIGLVFQDNALFPHLDVSANIGFGLKGMKAAPRRERVAALLARLHVAHLADAWPHMLSGGEQQRVAIARAMAREPALLLLDEPFSGLDGHLRAMVRQALLADLRAMGTTVLVVTHDPEEAMTIADDLILMAAGRVLQTGSPEQCYRRPVSEAAARLLGDATLLDGTVKDGRATTALGPLGAPGHADGPVRVIVRPEGLLCGADGPAARVTAVRFAGSAYNVDLAIGDLAITVRHPGPPPVPDSMVALGVDPAAAHILAG